MARNCWQGASDLATQEGRGINGVRRVFQKRLQVIEKMERETGIGPATNSLEGCDSTIELLPHLVELYTTYDVVTFTFHHQNAIKI